MDAYDIFMSIAAIHRAGATKARQWVYNNDMQIQAAVLDAMADEAEAQAKSALARHD